MVAGSWMNQDGLYLQFGTQKAVPEVGGEYMVYGPYRTVETYVCLANTQFGGSTSGMFVSVPALPSSFSGTSTAIAAGIQSLTEFLPLQQTASVTTSNVTGGGLLISNPQLWVDSIEAEVLVAANAGTGGATGITVGLAYATENGASSAFAQSQISGPTNLTLITLTNAAMSAGKRWIIMPDGTITGSSSTGVTAGNYLGNVPVTISFLNGSSGALANSSYVSSVAAGGTYTGTSAAGLIRVRVNYAFYGTINQ